jgi:hypothetical protein
LFGKDEMKWRFVCPVCKHVQSIQDYKDAGAPKDAVAFSCVGRWIDRSRSVVTGKGKGPCNYAGGGLFRLNPVEVVMENGEVTHTFAFDEGKGDVDD